MKSVSRAPPGFSFVRLQPILAFKGFSKRILVAPSRRRSVGLDTSHNETEVSCFMQEMRLRGPDSAKSEDVEKMIG